MSSTSSGVRLRTAISAKCPAIGISSSVRLRLRPEWRRFSEMQNHHGRCRPLRWVSCANMPRQIAERKRERENSNDWGWEKSLTLPRCRIVSHVCALKTVGLIDFLWAGVSQSTILELRCRRCRDGVDRPQLCGSGYRAAEPSQSCRILSRRRSQAHMVTRPVPSCYSIIGLRSRCTYWLSDDGRCAFTALT
jgi:hypothetical protein